MAKITLLPSNTEFHAEANEHILTAGLNANLNLPHGCKSGDCSDCKCKVVSGSITHDTYNSKALTTEELTNGYTLLCRAYAHSDLVLDMPNYSAGFPIRNIPTRVDKITKINNTAILTLKLPPTQKFDFYAGQYIDIILTSKNRSYSIASSPTQIGEIELHVRLHAGGVFSEYVWNELQEKQLMRFRGPLGNFKLQNSNRPILLVCTGTGFAPIKAILDDMLANNNQRQINLYWGNRTTHDFYLLNILDKWKEQLNIDITLCLSQDNHSDYTSGYVTTAITNDFQDLTQYEVYACGNLKMIEDVYNLAQNKLGLDKNNFFSDAFTPSN